MQDRGWWWVGAKEDLWGKGGFMVQRRIYGAKEDLWGKGGFMGQRRIYGAKEDLWGNSHFCYLYVWLTSFYLKCD
jgi:hypothetical protein